MMLFQLTDTLFYSKSNVSKMKASTICVACLLIIMTVLNSVTANITVEVYQYVPILRLNSTNGSDIELNLKTDSFKLPSGVSCKYSPGTCYDHKTRKKYHWKVRENLKSDKCKNLNLIHITSYNDEDFPAFKNNSLIILDEGLALALTKEHQFCGRSLWKTNRTGFVVYIGNDTVTPFEVHNIDYEVLDEVKRGKKSEFEDRLAAIEQDLANTKKENALIKNELRKIYQILCRTESLPSRLHHTMCSGESTRHIQRRNIKRSAEYQETPLIDPAFNAICSTFFLFPCENLIPVAVIFSYVLFSVINTVINYFSLRMLQNRKDRYIIFYCLTQGLTTRYVCMTQSSTKRKVDKWLLDIETPSK